MKREIKFRAWLEDDLEMIELPLVGLQHFDFEGSYALSFVIDGYDGFWGHECYEKIKPKYNLMQFIGLQDSKGVDIYQCDMLGDEFNSIGVVVWLADSASFAIDYGDDIQDIELTHEWATVIGNIYEHPELLTKK